MQIKSMTLHPYEIILTHGLVRSGALIQLIDEKANCGWGEVAPLPNWSKENLDECFKQLDRQHQALLQMDWTLLNCFENLSQLGFLPSVEFGLESALLSLLAPVESCSLPACALLMGSLPSILGQARMRRMEGYTSAKLKVSQLSFEEARDAIELLKDHFRLRIDVNRAWNTSDSIRFFEQFPLETFDYVEEPFSNPHDLALFPHPLAVDESFPENLSLEQLESLPTLKALIYKPTMQGGMCGCLPLLEWTVKRGITLVLSSSFETDVGLAHIGAMACRLGLSSPIGVGTYHYLPALFCADLQFLNGKAHVLGKPVLKRPRV